MINEGYVLGALLIGIILERKEDKNNFTPLSNQNRSNYNSSDGELDFDHKQSCGSNNCPLTQLKVSLSQPSLKSIYILYTSMCIIVIISIANIFMFTDDLEYKENTGETKEKSPLKLIGKLTLKPKQ